MILKTWRSFVFSLVLGSYCASVLLDSAHAGLSGIDRISSWINLNCKNCSQYTVLPEGEFFNDQDFYVKYQGGKKNFLQ